MISIIMPTYNRGYIISRAIESVLHQTYSDFELLVIDDGSSDNTCEIIRRYTDSRIKYIKLEKNMGGNHARNIGMKKAGGDIIAFLDSDNTWDACYLEKRIEAFEDRETGLVFGRVELNGEETAIFPHNMPCELDTGDNLKKTMLMQNAIDTNGACIRKAWVESVGGFDESMTRFQDWDFFFRVIMHSGYGVVFQDNVLAHNYLQPDSISRKNELYWENRVHILKNSISLCREWDCLPDLLWNLFGQCRESLSKPMKKKIFSLFTKEELGTALSRHPSYDMINGYIQSINGYIQSINEYTQLINRHMKIFRKNERIMQLQNKWIKFYIEGNRMADVLYSKGFQRIGVYGYGMTGKMLCCDIESDKRLTLSLLIERDEKRRRESGCRHAFSFEEVKAGIAPMKTDSIIVTIAEGAEEIIERIEEAADCPVLSLETILDEAQK